MAGAPAPYLVSGALTATRAAPPRSCRVLLTPRRLCPHPRRSGEHLRAPHFRPGVNVAHLALSRGERAWEIASSRCYLASYVSRSLPASAERCRWQSLPQTLPLLASGRPTAPACRGATSVATGSSTRSSRLQLKTGSRGMRACTAGGMSIARMTAARAWIWARSATMDGLVASTCRSKFTSQLGMMCPSRYGHPNGQCPFRLALEPYSKKMDTASASVQYGS